MTTELPRHRNRGWRSATTTATTTRRRGPIVEATNYRREHARLVAEAHRLRAVVDRLIGREVPR